MEDFLGTSIQFSEQEIKRLEEEHALQVEQTVARLIEEGFLDSDYDGSSGEYSDDDDSSYSENDDDDDIDNDNNCIQQKEEMKSNDNNILSSNNIVIDNSDISDVSTVDIMTNKLNNNHHNKQIQRKEILKQMEVMEEMKSYSTDDEDVGEQGEEEEEENGAPEHEIENEVTENIIFCATFRRFSAYYSDRENSYKYDSDDMTEDSQLYENDEISGRIFEIVSRSHELSEMIIIDFDDDIYQIIGKYSESIQIC